MNASSTEGTIVLVHGAWADGSCWSNVILPLKRRGFKVIAAPIPLTSLSDDAAALRRAIERTTGPVTLVAHAYAGAVIAAVHDDRVRSLVYVAALAPDENETVAPESYTLDSALLERPGNKEIQLDLFLDYASNVALYPNFQQYFRQSKPPLLAIWGKNDPFFIPAGAEAYRRDIPDAEVRFLNTGHFALETHVAEIAAAIKEFLEANAASGQHRKAASR